MKGAGWPYEAKTPGTGCTVPPSMVHAGFNVSPDSDSDSGPGHSHTLPVVVSYGMAKSVLVARYTSEPAL